MSNHGDEPFDFGGNPEEPKKMEAIQKRNALMRDLLNTTGFRGALGEFPEGKMTKDDEGAIQFALGAKDGKVVLDFGSSVHWVGMTPQQAADLASALMKKAREVARTNGEMVSFTIG